MWVKTTDKKYVNLVSGTVLYTRLVDATSKYGIFAHGVSFYPSGAPLAEGFDTQEDAQNSLDEFMNEQGYETVQPPVAEEEV